VAQRSVREQLVEAASLVFLQRGFHASSVNDLVEAAGVPKGSFYNHFDSKDALALEVVRRYAESYDMGLLGRGEASPLARARAHFQSVADRTIERGVGLGCLLGTFSTELATHSSEISAYVSGAFKHWGAAVAECLRDAQKAGELSPHVDTAALGDSLVDAYEGAVARAKVSQSRAPLDSFMRVMFDELLPSTPRPARRAPLPRRSRR
jgi:TetR/AcrR family transcriptional regulator, transcriptional repressor for nem operon